MRAYVCAEIQIAKNAQKMIELERKKSFVTQLVMDENQKGGDSTDKQRLEAYRSNIAEIKELQHKLEHLTSDDSLVSNSVILDYRKGYPQPQSVVGYDLNLERQRRARWTKRLAVLQTEINEVEAWIEAIPDGVTRRCFRMVYVDGMTQRQVAKQIHLDRSCISRKMDGYLKNAHKTPKTPL